MILIILILVAILLAAIGFICSLANVTLGFAKVIARMNHKDDSTPKVFYSLSILVFLFAIAYGLIYYVRLV